MSSKTYDVVIIGAGIVGSACAAECANEGLTVAIVEAGIIGGGATAAGMGHLTVMDDSEAQFALTRYSQQLWDQMSDALPREVEHDACGTIWVAADDAEMQEVFRKQKFYSERGVAVEVLDEQVLAEARNLVARILEEDPRRLQHCAGVAARAQAAPTTPAPITTTSGAGGMRSSTSHTTRGGKIWAEASVYADRGHHGGQKCAVEAPPRPP